MLEENQNVSNEPKVVLDGLGKLLKNLEDEKTINETLKPTTVIDTIADEPSSNDKVMTMHEYNEKPEPESQPEPVVEKPKTNLNAINIITAKREDYLRIRKQRADNEPVTQIVAAQSGYNALIAGLSSAEIENMNDAATTMDAYKYNNAKLTKIHSKMKNTNVGKMSYNDFLRVTSMFDINTFYYGMYCSTYPDPVEYPFTCKKCGTKHKLKIPHKNLILLSRDPDEAISTKNSIIQIVNDVHNASELYEKSSVRITKRIELPSSGIVVDIKIPTLYDQLERTIKNLTEAIVAEDTLTPNFMPFVAGVLIPVDNGYIPVTQFEDVFYEISHLDDTDMTVLVNSCTDIVKENRVQYGFRDIKCPNPDCEYVDESDIVIEDVSSLIFMIHQLKTRVPEK